MATGPDARLLYASAKTGLSKSLTTAFNVIYICIQKSLALSLQQPCSGSSNYAAAIAASFGSCSSDRKTASASGELFGLDFSCLIPELGFRQSLGHVRGLYVP